MPATSFQALTFDDILTTTLNEHRPNMVDNLYRASATLNGVTKGGVKKVLDGGARIIQPVLVTAPSGFSSYGGTDTFTTTINQRTDAAQYEWAQIGGTIGITGTQEILNAGKHARIRMVKAAIEIGEKEIRDQVNTMLLGDGTGNAAKDMLGLNAIISKAALTVGGLSETTYTAWAPQRTYATTNVTGFGASQTSATGGYYAMQDTWSLCTDGTDSPDLLISAREPFLSYMIVIGQNTRYIISGDDNKLFAGWYGSLFNGAPIVVERNALMGTYADDNATIFFANTNYLDLWVHQDRNFIVEPWQKPINQDARYAKLLFAGQLTVSNRRMQGVMEVNGV